MQRRRWGLADCESQKQSDAGTGGILQPKLFGSEEKIRHPLNLRCIPALFHTKNQLFRTEGSPGASGKWNKGNTRKKGKVDKVHTIKKGQSVQSVHEKKRGNLHDPRTAAKGVRAKSIQSIHVPGISSVPGSFDTSRGARYTKYTRSRHLRQPAHRPPQKTAPSGASLPSGGSTAISSPPQYFAIASARFANVSGQ